MDVVFNFKRSGLQTKAEKILCKPLQQPPRAATLAHCGLTSRGDDRRICSICSMLGVLWRPLSLSAVSKALPFKPLPGVSAASYFCPSGKTQLRHNTQTPTHAECLALPFPVSVPRLVTGLASSHPPLSLPSASPADLQSCHGAGVPGNTPSASRHRSALAWTPRHAQPQ